MKKVYGYLRVSTVKQGDGVSLIEQKEAINRYAKQYNLEIIEWFEEKETAAKLGRPLFTRMLKQLRARKAVGVIIHKIDRGARNLKDWSDIGTLSDQGVEVHFAHESLDLQARGGRLSADIQAVIAADYIRNLRQETIKGIYGRLKQGYYPFNAPIGYINNGPGELKTIDPIHGPLVKKAFELYATGNYNLDTLVEQMQRLGLKGMHKKRVARNSISILLNNPFYMGIIEVKGTTYNGKHEPVVPPTLFKKVQEVLRRNTNQKVATHDFKYKKLISCHHCGYSLTGEVQKGFTYYRCHTNGCITKAVREEEIEGYLSDAYASIELNPEESAGMDKILKGAQHEWVTKQQELLNGIKLQEAQLNQKIDKLTDCYLEGGLDKESFERRKTNLLVEIKAVAEHKEQIQSENDTVLKQAKKFFEQAKTLKNSHINGILEEQRELAKIVTSNLKVDGKKLIISMRSPFLELYNRHIYTAGVPDRDALRTGYTSAANSDIRKSSSSYKPLPEEKLKLLLDAVLQCITQLPETYNNKTNDIQTDNSSA